MQADTYIYNISTLNWAIDTPLQFRTRTRISTKALNFSGDYVFIIESSLQRGHYLGVDSTEKIQLLDETYLWKIQRGLVDDTLSFETLSGYFLCSDNSGVVLVPSSSASITKNECSFYADRKDDSIVFWSTTTRQERLTAIPGEIVIKTPPDIDYPASNWLMKIVLGMLSTKLCAS